MDLLAEGVQVERVRVEGVPTEGQLVEGRLGYCKGIGGYFVKVFQQKGIQWKGFQQSV